MNHQCLGVQQIRQVRRQFHIADKGLARFQAAFDANVPGLHPEVLRMLGRLKYRTSYGQNQLNHAVEVGKLAAVVASELKADVEVSKAGALLHDLGKAMDHNTEGTHAMLGAELAKVAVDIPAVPVISGKEAVRLTRTGQPQANASRTAFGIPS